MLVRSVPIKIEVTESIVDTLDLYKQGLQYCIENGRTLGINNNIKLHPFVYSSLRKIGLRSEEHTSELQSHSFISYAVFCLKKKKI